MTLVELFSKPGTWCQGDEALRKLGYCLLSGARFVYKTNEAVHEAVLKLHSVEEDLVDWNDAPGRTQAEVLELCRKAGV